MISKSIQSLSWIPNMNFKLPILHPDLWTLCALQTQSVQNWTYFPFYIFIPPTQPQAWPASPWQLECFLNHKFHVMISSQDGMISLPLVCAVLEYSASGGGYPCLPFRSWLKCHWKEDILTTKVVLPSPSPTTLCSPLSFLAHISLSEIVLCAFTLPAYDLSIER